MLFEELGQRVRDDPFVQPRPQRERFDRVRARAAAFIDPQQGHEVNELLRSPHAGERAEQPLRLAREPIETIFLGHFMLSFPLNDVAAEEAPTGRPAGVEDDVTSSARVDDEIIRSRHGLDQSLREFERLCMRVGIAIRRLGTEIPDAVI